MFKVYDEHYLADVFASQEPAIVYAQSLEEVGEWAPVIKVVDSMGTTVYSSEGV